MTRRNAGPASDEIGNDIERWRSEFGLTQQQLADIANVTRKTINTIENGHFVPSAVLALRIASAFGVAVEDVFWLADPLDPVDRSDFPGYGPTRRELTVATTGLSDGRDPPANSRIEQG